MLKIRLMRIGAKKRPFYRVVVVDERAKRNGAYVELVGTYNPLTEPKEIKLKKDRIDYWLKQGAQKSDGMLRILGEAPQRPPRKAKKSHSAEAPRDEVKVAETPKEQTKSETEETATPAPVAKEAIDDAAKSEVVEVIKVSVEPVIASEQSEAKQSSKDEDLTQIAAEPEAPRNDEKESKEKNERPA